MNNNDNSGNNIDISNNNIENFVQHIFNDLINDINNNVFDISNSDRILFNNYVNSQNRENSEENNEESSEENNEESREENNEHIPRINPLLIRRRPLTFGIPSSPLFISPTLRNNHLNMGTNSPVFLRNNVLSPVNRLRNTPITTPFNLDTVLENSFNTEAVYKNVASDEVIENLKTVKYKDSSKHNGTCPIICADFNDEDDVTELPCKHLFTPESITKWLKEENNECPICRYALESKEVKNEQNSPSTSPRRRREMNTTMFPNLYHNPMQRYLIEQIINSNRINENISENINEDDFEFQQAIMNSMLNEEKNEEEEENESDSHGEEEKEDDEGSDSDCN